ncbi:MAG: tRNA lysidine(34) synthetase TilS [Bacteroidia bacterium]
MKQIVKKVKEWIDENSLLKVGEKVICAISGGKDSVAMTLLLKELGFKVVLAHVNFNLRDQESNGDEAFVRDFAKSESLAFYCKSVDTKNQLQKGESVQLAARRIRYDWFESLSQELAINKIATAHTANDNAETIIYNLTKGAGLKGISGIPQKNGRIIRPIMCISTNEVLEYLKSKTQLYRSDSSNHSDKYARNKIRHHVSPVLTEINTGFNNTLLEHSKRFARINAFYFDAIKKSKSTFWQFNKKGWWQADISVVNPSKENAFLEHLLPLGFSETAILDVLKGTASAEASTDKHRLINARNKILLSKKDTTTVINKPIDIGINGIKKTSLGNLSWQINPELKKENLSKPHLAFISLDQVERIDSLLLRSVRTGDKMRPFGLKGQKLLSDLFSDGKLNTLEKEKSLVIELNNEIVWWVGKRIADNFKIKSKTTKWVMFDWHENDQMPFEW